MPPSKHAHNPRATASEQEGSELSTREREEERREEAREGKRSEAKDPMAFDLGYWLVTIPVRVLLVVITLVVIVVFLAVITLVVIFVFVFSVLVCAANIEDWWRSPWMRLLRLGGVTTLRRSLDYPCAMCRDSMDAGEKVRTLSCGHVFHCGGTAKCGFGIDQWLLAGNAKSLQSCPVCRQDPLPMPLWQRPPPSSRAASSPQTSDSDSSEDSEELLFPSHWFDASEDSEEEELLFPSHWFDETLLE